jgi:uncharacterized protein
MTLHQFRSPLIKGDVTRVGNWMQTATGGEFYPLDPRADEINIYDIAASLSKQCRYAGHCLAFYSVAEHCVLMARGAPGDLQLTALMHDASEAYLVDVPRPVKASLPNYDTIEAFLMMRIAERFGFAWPLPAEVKRRDNAILHDEMLQVMTTPPRDWGLTEPPLGVMVRFWTPNQAEDEFLRAFYEYGGDDEVTTGVT